MDTDSVGAGKTFYRKHAVFLTGGDVFGLKCAFGVQRFLLDNRLASSRKPSELPGVVGANIYDLEFGRALEKVDYERLGYEACRNANSGPVSEGNVGAGLGATIGKLMGIEHAMKGGVGSSVAKAAGGIFMVGALVVTNAVGNVFEPGGTTIAGARSGKRFLEMEQMDEYVSGLVGRTGSARATTVGVVVTDLELSHEEAIKVAEMAHDGLARCIRPVHGATDGDTIFCVSTGAVRVRRHSPDLLTMVGHLASIQVQSSVIRSVHRAKTLAGIPAAD
jgi:L-aminopeptidase/D-esterase-like protein